MSEDRSLNQADMAGVRKEQLVGMKGGLGKLKARVAERCSGMCVNEQKLRKSSGLVKGRRPEVHDAWSEEPVGTWQERCLPQIPRVAGGLQQLRRGSEADGSMAPARTGVGGGDGAPTAPGLLLGTESSEEAAATSFYG